MATLFIDTNCELNYQLAREAGLTNVIRMPYTICGKEYFYDLGEHYDAVKFFNTVREGNMPITSALNAEEYKDYFEPFFKKGEDILYLSFSSEMSGTFNHLDMAIKELQEKYPDATFTRFDTRGISLSAGIPVYFAGKMNQEGKTHAEIIEFLTNFIKRMNTILSVNDLHHLKRGGRLSSAQATLGSFFQVKPIIEMVDGKLMNTSKVNGRSKSLNVIADRVIQNVRDVDKYPIGLLNADCKEDSDKIKNKILEAFPNANIWDYDVGPVIGTHCGPDTVAAIFVGDPK